MENSDDALDTLTADLEARRKASAADHADLLGDILHRRRLEDISRTMPTLTPEQLAAREAEQAQRDAEREQHARCDRWRAFVQHRGDRYAECRLKNFACPTESQAKAVLTLMGYCEAMGDRIADGEGVVLFGPKGTGKDHLAVALCRVAIAQGRHVVWQNGMDLFGDIRDAIDKGEAERALVSRLVAPDVLYLSDPLPPFGNLSEFQAGMLFRIIDGRYSRRRPLWVTVNVSSGDELAQRMGSQNADRIKDGAVAIHCDWPSNRKTKA